MKPRVDALTFLRFVAALAVVIYHFGPAAGLRIWPSLGPLMVTFFFVLSGFVLSVGNPIFDAGRTSRFLADRFSRIAPMYFIALVMMLLLLRAGGRELNLMALLLNASFLQAWISPFPMSINPPAWSLSVEAALYLSFPLVMSWASRRKPSASQLFLIAGLIWLLTQCVLSFLLMRGGEPAPAGVHDLVFYSPPAHFCSFLLGIAGGRWFSSAKPTPRSVAVATATLFASIGLLLLSLSFTERLRWILPFPLAVEASFLAPVFLMLILSIASGAAWLRDSLSGRAFIMLGNASFSLYILQMPAWHAWRFLMPGDGDAIAPMELIAFIISLVLVSLAAFRWVELPMMQLLRSLRGTPKAVTAAP